MSKATVFSSSQFGLATDVTATGLVVGSCTWTGKSESAQLPDHLGCASGFAVWNQSKDVTCEGIIATKGSGLVANIASVVTLANAATNTRTRNSEGLGVTAAGGAALIVLGNHISPTATGFEGGGLTCIYLPYVDTSSPVVLS